MGEFMKGHSGEWLKRQAAQIASQLPESRADALTVLTMARAIITKLDLPAVDEEGHAAGCGLGKDPVRPLVRLVSAETE